MEGITTILQRLNNRDPLPLLVPDKVWDPALSEETATITAEDIVSEGEALPSEQVVEAVRSSLLLLNDDLDASHDISQGLEDSLGSYLHGVMHRREGDFPNAKYWFRLAGDHPIHALLYDEGQKIDNDLKQRGRWDPAAMVDEVERVYRDGAEDSEKGIALRKLQMLEMQMLVGFSVGSGVKENE
ncbi:hypothetical protein [Gracilibacillus alcaliphilus]|uniref:hypothetical protein n=1 Tax=Gracilibacillus alcaliphilus TaxID=1401441 RepID=UPI001959FAA1|nr:hypothetical protein [Gracilibacillus alcaliphilus]MBM7675609.1 hypothetical protein [Gracilibacillus alcaliphilus]